MNNLFEIGFGLSYFALFYKITREECVYSFPRWYRWIPNMSSKSKLVRFLFKIQRFVNRIIGEHPYKTNLKFDDLPYAMQCEYREMYLEQVSLELQKFREYRQLLKLKKKIKFEGEKK